MTDADEIFDWDAFMRDTIDASAAATGAWLRCLYKMRLSVTRGRISRPIVSYARLFGTTVEQAGVLIDEITSLQIGDAVTENNKNVTLTNRRMYRTYLVREANKHRQSERRKKLARGENSECHENVTNGHKSHSSSVENNNPKEERKKQKKSLVSSSRIPDPFPLTQEMVDWVKVNVAGLRLIEAHDKFIEYYTNLTTAKAYKVDWMLTWKNGMKMALKWQLADGAKSSVGKSSPAEFTPDPPCEFCGKDVCLKDHRFDEQRSAA